MQSIADRYTYLPSIGLFIAVVWSMATLGSSSSSSSPFWRTSMAALAAFLLLACGLDTRYQLRFWRDNITLFQHVVDVTPDNNFLGYFYLGISYGDLGELDPAARCLAASLEANPKFELARSRLGNVLLVQKKYPAAEPLLQSVAKAHPDDFVAHATLGMALAGEQKYAAAQSEFLAAQRLNPNDPAINQLVAANAPKAEVDQKLTTLAGQLEANPTPETRAQAAMAQAVLGRYAEASQQYKLALAQKPDATEWLNNLAWLLATCPDETVRNGQDAVPLAERACALTQYKKTVYLGTLAAACAEAGRFDNAVLNARKACDTASANGETDLLAANQRLLALYQNHQPYHEPAPAAAP
jgi:tetratricopeptide (TPR) repeat protein